MIERESHNFVEACDWSYMFHNSVPIANFTGIVVSGVSSAVVSLRRVNHE